MIDRHAWNAYARRDRESSWVWVGSGAWFTEANSVAVLRAPDAERTVIFGRALPGKDGEPVPIQRRCY